MRAFLAVVLAMLSSSLYAAATSLQALEAREAPASTALRASLIARLARRRVWLVGSAAGVGGWGAQAGALALASVAFVQPALGLGLIVLLVFGVRLLHERIGPREIGGAAAIAAAVGVLAWAAPERSTSFTTFGRWFVGAMLVFHVLTPWVLRAARRAGGLVTSLAAGFGWAGVGLATALTVESIAARDWPAALGWAIGVGAASWTTMIAEMSALQAWPATRAIPVAFGLEMTFPPAVAPLLGHESPPHPVAFALALAVACAGAVALGSSRGVARVAVPLTEP